MHIPTQKGQAYYKSRLLSDMYFSVVTFQDPLGNEKNSYACECVENFCNVVSNIFVPFYRSSFEVGTLHKTGNQ